MKQVLKTSLLTIVHGRKSAFFNLLQGIERSNTLPDELIIVFMNEAICELPSFSFCVKCFSISDDSHLPLAAARNLAAKEASGDLLIFLDVDCIPHPNLIGAYLHSSKANTLLCGSVRYLNASATEQRNFFDRLDQYSIADPIRGQLPNLPYELFWSLNFACERLTYQDIGGFDENFNGYGAEDTDFSFTARKKAVKIATIGAVAYHQHHASYAPPLNHFKDIVANALTFYNKWQTWAMEGWLTQFEYLGLIKRTQDDISIIRYPEKKEIANALK
ncbi:glycosyltransferase family 2 protein [Pedobacter sandarakinus]|uniref:glycosyltransferase family 2 protein n=1 Tax=Pedobacter sandarakinus TaxID=353156 RepID=UPI002246D4DC|nr:glycosyltransferase family 2 protein [Pedobacter sandarakinus]MCX2574141.1 glycosyltransferase family 2 protein [Pedobacter sandarakinus]